MLMNNERSKINNDDKDRKDSLYFPCLLPHLLRHHPPCSGSPPFGPLKHRFGGSRHVHDGQLHVGVLVADLCALWVDRLREERAEVGHRIGVTGDKRRKDRGLYTQV